MKSKEPPRNRIAKALPREWQDYLLSVGVPKRKYTALVRAELVGSVVIEEMVIEQGWIIGLDRGALVGKNERQVAIDPRQILSLTLLQVI